MEDIKPGDRVKVIHDATMTDTVKEIFVDELGDKRIIGEDWMTKTLLRNVKKC